MVYYRGNSGGLIVPIVPVVFWEYE